MRTKNFWITLLTLCALCACPPKTQAREYCTSTGGAAYESAYQSCCIAPAIGFALLAIAGIIAVGVHNRHHSSHSHGDDDSN